MTLPIHADNLTVTFELYRHDLTSDWTLDSSLRESICHHLSLRAPHSNFLTFTTQRSDNELTFHKDCPALSAELLCFLSAFSHYKCCLIPK